MVLRILEARILRKLFQLLLLCTTLSTSQLNKVKSFGSCSQVNTETYSEPSQASKIELLQENTEAAIPSIGVPESMQNPGKIPVTEIVHLLRYC